MRERLYEIIEVGDNEDDISHFYDVFMIITILFSIVPLGMKQESVGWLDVESICVSIFIIDYALRLLTADYKMNDHSLMAFLKYPFTPLAIIDLMSILPRFIMLNSGFGLLRLIRLAKALRVFRIFRIFRYSENIDIILAVIKRSKDSLIAVGTLTIAYILTSALIVMNAEPYTFDDFFDAVYWSTISLTTIGYGDIVPVSLMGKLVTIVSAFFGIGVIALPAGILTAGIMEELQERKLESRRARRRKKKSEEHDYQVRD